MNPLTSLFIISASLTAGREITFPPVAGIQSPLGHAGLQEFDDRFDISAALYSGLTTFANLPYVHCLAADGHEVESYDIAIVGAPFDTVSLASIRVRIRF